MDFVELIMLVVIATILVTVITLGFNKKAVPNIQNDDDVIHLLNEGNRLKAIKAYRQLHGSGLKEAKEFVDKCVPSNKKEDT